MIERYAFVLSYDYPKLSLYEALSCLKSEDVVILSSIVKERILLVKVQLKNEEQIINAARRSATIKEVIKPFQLLKDLKIDLSSLKDVLKSVQTFGVRASCFSTRKFDSREIEWTVGHQITNAFPNIKVNLRNPDVWIRVIVVEDLVIIGIPIFKEPKGFHERSAGKRPFLIASTLKPKLALSLVNLSGVRKGQILLDPFCGAGSILIEAALLGVETIGCDIFKKHVQGTRSNLKWANVDTLGVIRCDSCFLPIRKVDAIVTDPPYGREAPVGGHSVEEIYEFIIRNARDILRTGGSFVFIHPKGFDIPSSEACSFTELYKVEIPVHGSLIRVIRVWEKK